MFRNYFAPVLIAVALAAGLLFSAATLANQRGAPAPINDTYPFAAGEACAFPIAVTFAGKLKSLFLSGNRITTIWPKLETTITNLAAPDKSITLRGGGTFHDAVQPDGSVLSGNTGHVYLIGGRFGATLYIGNFYVTLPVGGDYSDPVGNFRQFDLCALIE